MTQYRLNTAYGLTQALISAAPIPIQGRRAPTAADMGHLPGTLWVNLVNANVYVLATVVANAATWIQISVGAGAFATLSSSGATTLATAGASVNTFGNTTGATSLSLYAGTGNFLVDGAPATTIALGASLTTGTITIGGSAQTGTMTIAGGNGAQTLNIASNVAGVKTINIGNQAGASGLFLLSGTAGLGLESTGSITSATTENAVEAISISADGGILETIVIRSVQGTSAQAVSLVADAGGILLESPPAFGVQISNGTQFAGIYVGTGSPNAALTAPKGSLYLNVGGSGVADRLFVNTNGAQAWTAITTVA